MANTDKENRKWKTTIIISTAIQNHDVSCSLSAQQHRIRYTDSVETGSLIFPLSGIAFLIVDTQEFPENQEETAVFEKIKNFIGIHRNSFLLLLASLHGPKRMQNIIQNSAEHLGGLTGGVAQSRLTLECTTANLYSNLYRFLTSNLRIIPVHNTPEIIKSMLTIAKATSKPHVDSVRDQMTIAKAQIIERSSVWEMLRNLQLGCE